LAEPFISDEVGAHPDSPRRTRRHNTSQGGGDRGSGSTSKMNDMFERFIPKGSPAAKRDRGLLLAIAMTCVVLGLQYDHTLLAVGAGVIAALDLQVLILWSFFVGSLVAAILGIIGGLLLLLPLQFLPATLVNHEKRNKLRIIVICILWFVFAWSWLRNMNTAGRFLLVLITTILVGAIAYASVAVREKIADLVINSLVLPASGVGEQEIMLGNGHRIRAAIAIEQLRSRAFSSSHITNTSSNTSSGSGWTNIKLAAYGTATRIDAAYYENPAQAQVRPEERRWIMWFLGNGECYEMMLHDFQSLASFSGMNILVFNYRGVNHSEGRLVQAWDLVEDGRLCLDHLVDTLGAQPEHVILFGHSIGGAVAAQLRAEHSPHGPLVVDRSFSSLATAAKSVFSVLSKSLLGFALKIPTFVIIGLLNSVFKGKMDAVEAWNGIKGSRMVIYHLEDAVISYDPASLHFALSEQKAFGMANADLTIPGAVDSIRLGLDGEAGQGNHHNLPLERFPEFPLILRKCRQMVGLTPDLPRTIAPPTGGPSFGGR